MNKAEFKQIIEDLQDSIIEYLEIEDDVSINMQCDSVLSELKKLHKKISADVLFEQMAEMVRPS